jgi:GT2 family glycosyltransferase
VTTSIQSPRISVLVLAHGVEPYLADCVGSVLTGAGQSVEVIVVDNEAHTAVSALPTDDRLRVVTPPCNLGFAGGCNEASRHAAGDTLVLLNSDAIVEPGAIERLTAALAEPGVGVVCGSVRLADAPDRINSVGNPVHFLGIAWAGGFGDPAAKHGQRRDVASATGAFCGIRRALWDELGGLPEVYFAYHEDTELSLRVWQRGLRVVYEPSAVARHHYTYSRNGRKQYLLQRNRWLTVLTVYPRPVLLVVLPMMLAFDLALVAVAAAQGWLSQLVHAWAWLVGHPGWVRRRRSAVQSLAVLPAREFAALLTARVEPAMVESPSGTVAANAILAAYWNAVRRWL